MRLQKPDWRQDDPNPEDLQKAVVQLLEQVAKRDQKIAERDALLLYTRARLAEKESQLSGITDSRIWKLLRPIRWIRNFLVASRSARRTLLRQGSRMILSSLRKPRRN
jgi:hypothetical protein